MANKLLSISLGTGTAKLAEVLPNGRKVSVFSAYDIELPDGLCEDGVIIDPEALAKELKLNIIKYGITCKKLVFSIASKRIATKEVVIPFVKEKQIQSIIQTNAPEYFPVSNIEEYVLSYSILEVVQSETKQYRLSVTATPNELLKGYDDLAKSLKMTIEVMDHAGNSILQILKSQALAPDVVAILQLGRENTVINIMSGGVLIMQRSVSNGLEAIVNAVRDAFKLDEAEAYAFVEDNDITKICQAYPEVNDVTMQIVMSISRIFEFYNSRSGEHPITAVKYIGDGSIVNGIGSAIEQNLALPTEEILHLYSVDIKGKYGLTAEQATNFLSNIGAVIKPVKLKYVPVGAEGEKEGDGKLPIWAVIVAAVAAVVMIAASFGLYSVNKIKVNALKKQADALQPMREVEARLNDALAVCDAIDGFYQSTKGANDSISRMVKDLEEIFPSGMSVDSMSIDNGRVSINGGGIGKKSVARIITELKGLKYVNDVYVDYISEVNDLAGKYDTFSLSFTLADINAIEFEEQQQAEAEAAAAAEADIEIEVDNAAEEGGEQ